MWFPSHPSEIRKGAFFLVDVLQPFFASQHEQESRFRSQFRGVNEDDADTVLNDRCAFMRDIEHPLVFANGQQASVAYEFKPFNVANELSLIGLMCISSLQPIDIGVVDESESLRNPSA